MRTHLLGTRPARSAPVVMLSLSTQTVAAIALAAAILYAATVNLFQQLLTQWANRTGHILERSRTALWRLIHATAKSSSSLNTYPIPDFFGPAAMQRATFSRARKILGIRILPRAPTLQTYLFWPIGVPEPRELAQYSSDSRFFWSSCNATCDIFTCVKKK